MWKCKVWVKHTAGSKSAEVEATGVVYSYCPVRVPLWASFQAQRRVIDQLRRQDAGCDVVAQTKVVLLEEHRLGARPRSVRELS